jgi:hypothetical protein
MADEKKIKQLLEAFYNGNTTLEEEALLLKFFNSEGLDEKWYTDKDLFNVLHDSSDIKLPKGISERLENVIDIHMAKETIPQKSHSKTRKLLIRITSVAAVLLLCIGLFFTTNKPVKSYTADTYTDPEEAAMVAEQALMLVSAKLNQGFHPLEKVKESVNKTNELLNESLKLN